jgi:hypothetical protein
MMALYTKNLERKLTKIIIIQGVLVKANKLSITAAKCSSEKRKGEVFTMVTMKNGVFWDVTECLL